MFCDLNWLRTLRFASVLMALLLFWLAMAPKPIGSMQLPFGDFPAHVILFAGLGLICFLGWSDRPKLIFAILLAIAVGTEGMQNFIPRRQMNFSDFLGNLSGIFLGYSGAVLLIKMRLRQFGFWRKE